uniref:CAP-Gly domain-containing protein n=1 Tax=Elaeophora elaphi TaxID=1147741 RepID=A0A0R3RJC1_9BILA
MYKSTNDKASNEGELIGRKDIGKKVIVGRVGAGTLMYVGPVEGKTGIFCGIELDHPEGKHDGTYQGIAYFHCAPLHGIFAPSYKVELLQQVSVAARREEKLVRSAIPAIAGGVMEMSAGTGTAQSMNVPSMDISMASVSSLGSASILEHSMMMSGSWNSDAMVNSQATYTISGPIGRSHYQLLEEIECPSELIEVDDDVLYPQLNTSLVLDESRIGVDRLPIVDDNLSTPLVEYAPNIDSQLYQQQQQNHGYMLDSYGNHYNAYQDRNDLSTNLATSLSVTQLIHPDALSSYGSEFPQQVSNVLSPTERVQSSMSIDSTGSDDVTLDTNHHLHSAFHDAFAQQRKSPLHVSFPEQEILPATATTSTEVTESESNCYKPSNGNLTIAKESVKPTEHLQHKNVMVEKPESVVRKEEKKERPKKPRPMSIRELQNAPVPVRPPKPKPPSKSQLLMEKLKASIEADKHKPKKDVKSKLHEILSANASARRTQPQAVVNGNEGWFFFFFLK